MKHLRVLVGRPSIGIRGTVFRAPDLQAERLIADGLVEEIDLAAEVEPLPEIVPEPMVKNLRSIEDYVNLQAGEKPEEPEEKKSKIIIP